MRWGDITARHDGCRASVSAASTPDSPDRGAGPFTGTIVCAEGCVPYLLTASEAHHFADWFDVEVLQRPGMPYGVIR